MFCALLTCLTLLGADAADEADRLATYNSHREHTPKTAAAQWKLALWCEENGLEAEKMVHLIEVVRLDPKRAEAWKKLGYKKHDGKWRTDAQIADEAEQKAADRKYADLLKSCHKHIHAGPKRPLAEETLGKLTDPRAVPSIYIEFARGAPADQKIAIQLLGQIKGIDASKTLALMSIYGKTPDVRRNATETLRGREPSEYMDILIGVLDEPLRFEVRPVGGPGSPGVLFVEGEQFNVRRFYAPSAPKFQLGWWDMVGYDANGEPFVVRPHPEWGYQRLSPDIANVALSLGVTSMIGVKGKDGLYGEQAEIITRRDLIADAQAAALNMSRQLVTDIGWIEDLNAARKQFNDQLCQVMKDATGQDIGPKREEWKSWLAKHRGRTETTPRRIKPTIDQIVPMAALPLFGRLTFLVTSQEPG